MGNPPDLGFREGVSEEADFAGAGVAVPFRYPAEGRSYAVGREEFFPLQELQDPAPMLGVKARPKEGSRLRDAPIIKELERAINLRDAVSGSLEDESA